MRRHRNARAQEDLEGAIILVFLLLGFAGLVGAGVAFGVYFDDILFQIRLAWITRDLGG